MRIVIVGGGIVAAYMANEFKKQSPEHDVMIVSKEEYPPYDRIHLCSLIKHRHNIREIALELPSDVRLELNSEVMQIDRKAKRIYTRSAVFSYDILIVATGSKPRMLFGIEGMKNATTFRSAKDSECISEHIKGKNVVMMGVGPIGLELLDALCSLEGPQKIYLVSRGKHLYDKAMTPTSVEMIKQIFEAHDPRVEILLEDEIVDKVVEGDEITKIVMKSRTIENPFVIFGIGVSPSADLAEDVLDVDKGILVDEHMRTCDESIYAVGEVAQLSNGYIAGRVKECTLEADAAIASILGKKDKGFKKSITIDGLKVGSFLLADVSSTNYDARDENNENIVIASKKEGRIDHYITNNDRLVRFIGINTNIDVMALKRMMMEDTKIDTSYFYSNRLISEKGKLICS